MQEPKAGRGSVEAEAVARYDGARLSTNRVSNDDAGIDGIRAGANR